MTNRNYILSELESIAPGLVNVPVAMPYALPEGYFEMLPAEILNHLGLDENHALAPHIVSASNNNLYSIPAGYFDTLADTIMDRIYREEAETAAVPQGYFDSLPDMLLHKVRSMDVQEELAELAPLLNTINKQPVNFVPEGYFENLEPAVEETQAITPVAEDTSIKVVAIKKKNNWLKYAVAACLTGVIAFTAVKIINTPSVPVDQPIETKLASISDSTLENYLSKDQTLTEYSVMASNIVSEDDITDFLQDFSDEELQQYLKSEGEEIASN